MGVTIHYRGGLNDIDRVEDFEDRVLDFALAIGASARVWRSVSDQRSDRIVRGLIVELAPGQESTSLLISPEGWLVNLLEIEAAENGVLGEPSWCSVKTQFGPLEGHVALVELLDAVKREFMSNLEVEDEGGYWRNRDLGELSQKTRFLSQAIDALADGLDRYPLSDEAAQDPEILASRVERVAKLVHRTMGRPSEHPPAEMDGADDWAWTKEREAEWDAAYREQRRKQERHLRAMEERLAKGEDHKDAFENAMRDEGLIDLPGEEAAEDHFDESPETPWKAEPDATWRESPIGEDFDGLGSDEFSRQQHPLQRRASELMDRLLDGVNGLDENPSGQAQVLLGGAGDMMGGLAQALGAFGGDDEFTLDTMHRGLAIVQLKRALRGAAFAFGALFALAREGRVDDRAFEELRNTIEGLQDDIFAELQRFRGED
ncbi:MAG: hypothetical protein ACQESR_12935 [Planctomycetota bacterium]